MRPRTRAQAVCMSAAALVVVALICAALALLQMASASKPIASPSAQASASADAAAEQGWPEIDWDYWLKVNPDLCGWITIPGTDIDHPIVQASADAPSYYLKHDLSGAYNIWGCPYLDASCADRGLLSSKVAWVYGHNMLDGSMFEPIVDYVDEGFMEAHPKVWIQTPDGAKRSYDVFAAEVIESAERVKRTHFDDSHDFASWRDVRSSKAAATREGLDATCATRVLALVTCSHHNVWRNERTVVYCMPSADARDDGEERR